MQMVKINAKVKQETLKALKIEAEKDGRTESGMIRFILERYLHLGFSDGKPVTRDININKLKDMLGSGSEAMDITKMGEFYKNMPEETLKSHSDLNKNK